MYNASTIGVWGYGIVGKAAVEFFKNNCLKIIIFDICNPYLEYNEHIKFLQQTPYNHHEFLSSIDYCLVSPGIAESIDAAYQHKIITELDIFYKAIPTDLITIGITGSVGKTTISALLYALLNHVSTASVGGNIGIALFETLKQTIRAQTRYAVLELSSFQLQNIRLFAPKLAIITNLYANHLDRHGSQEEYGRAKSTIFTQQTANDTLIISSQAACHPALQAYLKEYKGKIILVKTDAQQVMCNYTTSWYIHKGVIIKESSFNQELYGCANDLPTLSFEHNWLFILASLDHLGYSFAWQWAQEQAANLLTIKTEDSKLACGEHRLEKIEKNGYIFYNDSKSTLIESSKAAVQALGHDRIILLLGGVSKRAERTKSIMTLHKELKHIICFGKEADILYQACQDACIESSKVYSLEDAFNRSLEVAHETDSILFSPGGASFDLFDNYQQRGNKFKELIKNL